MKLDCHCIVDLNTEHWSGGIGNPQSNFLKRDTSHCQFDSKEDSSHDYLQASISELNPSHRNQNPISSPEHVTSERTIFIPLCHAPRSSNKSLLFNPRAHQVHIPSTPRLPFGRCIYPNDPLLIHGRIPSSRAPRWRRRIRPRQQEYRVTIRDQDIGLVHQGYCRPVFGRGTHCRGGSQLKRRQYPATSG